MQLICPNTDALLPSLLCGQVYHQPAAMLDFQSPFAPAAKAAEKKLFEQLGDLEVSPILPCKSVCWNCFFSHGVLLPRPGSATAYPVYASKVLKLQLLAVEVVNSCSRGFVFSVHDRISQQAGQLQQCSASALLIPELHYADESCNYPTIVCTVLT